MQSRKKITIMIQARTKSKRLQGKVLAKIEKKPMIWYVINRVKKIKKVDQIILITTKRKIDQPLVNIAKKSGILWFTGSTYDVLDRHYRCAIEFDADPIIRITGDCPLIDPFLIEKMIKFYLTHKYDYVANNVIPTYPDGLDCQIVSFRALEKEWKIAKWKSEREHVMRYITNNPKKFKIFSYENDLDLSEHRWSIDEANDLKLVRKIYAKLKPKTIFSMKAILKVIKENPLLQEINKGITRDEGYLLSVKKDRRIK